MARALVIGATGLVGRALVQQLLQHPGFSQVTVFVRRTSGWTHPKLVEHRIDFEQPEQHAALVCGDVAFSALGTTARQAGSRQAQWRVDHDYQLDFARAARATGVRCFALVSAAGASSRSPVFYSRMKGQLEDEIRALGFPSLHILRPSFLEGERERNQPGQDRPAERLGILATHAMNRLGLLRRWRPVPAATVAQALIKAASMSLASPTAGAANLRKATGTQPAAAVHVWERDQIFDLAGR